MLSALTNFNDRNSRRLCFFFYFALSLGIEHVGKFPFIIRIQVVCSVRSAALIHRRPRRHTRAVSEDGRRLSVAPNCM